eukprot:TRINITY_DN12875_c0_g1_i1.p1 TRINITY_DN12875_c0_g1~~TRINITY_DN12875_c0_g1_i1.p1  ORF type:complete len:145 (-),score=11.59 TRINITY_DN12875_c0_g1_i1:45-479(-)
MGNGTSCVVEHALVPGFLHHVLVETFGKQVYHYQWPSGYFSFGSALALTRTFGGNAANGIAATCHQLRLRYALAIRVGNGSVRKGILWVCSHWNCCPISEPSAVCSSTSALAAPHTSPPDISSYSSLVEPCSALCKSQISPIPH